MAIITYAPPKTIKSFIKSHVMSQLFFDWIVGPVGSGKTTALFFKLVYMAKKQAPSPDGIRRTRAVIVRNTMPQLKDTTLVSWGYWFRDGQAGKWNATDKIFTLRYDDVECIVLFRPLDTPDDISRVLSLEVNFAIIDEFVEIPKAIIDALAARLGRYKLPDGTPVTIWGMWGSSNPSTEDNWWYDYLHSTQVMLGAEDETTFRARNLILHGDGVVIPNARYFHQPGGLHPDAENLDNLPGGVMYYRNVVKGRSKAWSKQYVDAEWGFSSVGQAVVTMFDPLVHIARRAVFFDPNLVLVIGFDPGITGSAMIFMQEDYSGQIRVLREIVAQGYSTERLLKEKLFPILRNDFPKIDLSRIVVALDPSGSNRVQSDAGSSKKVLEDFGFTVSCETNNRFPLRLAAYEHYLSTRAEMGPAFIVDESRCPIFVRALKGGWRYGADVKKDILKGVEPEKNPYSHPGDAGGYGLRYFHKGMLRYEKYGVRGRMTIPGTSRFAVVNATTPWGQAPQRPAMPSAPKYHYR